MLVLRLAGHTLSLLPNTKLTYELKNPFFSADSLVTSFSYSFTLPLDDNNRLSFGFPDVVENTASLRRVFADAELEDAGYVLGRGGELRIRSVLPDRVKVSISFGLSGLQKPLTEKLLPSYELEGLISFPDFEPSQGVFVPGITTHANETVDAPEDYDYIFAPLVNEWFPETDPPLVDPIPQRFNNWVWFEQAVFTPRTKGSFTYSMNFTVPGGIPGTPPPVAMGPLPRVAPLLRRLFQELGVFTASSALVGEWADLVLLHCVDVGGPFRLAQVLPAISLSELLRRLRLALGLYAEVGADGRLRLELVENVLASLDYDDWNHLVGPAFEEREITDETAVKLVYELDDEDTIAAAFYAGPPANLPILEPVATFADLPPAWSLSAGFVPCLRLVLDEGVYYRNVSTLDFTTGTGAVLWQKASSAYVPVQSAYTAGVEVQTQEQGITATATKVYSENSLNPSFRQEAIYPAWVQTPPTADEPTQHVRLGFYRGRQPYSIDPGHPDAANSPDYPLVTPFNVNAAGQRVGEYSLQLHGEDGTYERWLRRYYELLATAAPIKHQVYLSAADLAGLDLARKKQIAGVNYLVVEVRAELPLSKGATVTLMPLPRG